MNVYTILETVKSSIQVHKCSTIHVLGTVKSLIQVCKCSTIHVLGTVKSLIQVHFRISTVVSDNVKY